MTSQEIQDYILGGRRSKLKVWDMCRQADCLLFTGGAIVKDDKATLIVGSGTDNMLEATSQFDLSVIGTGRAILFDTKEKMVYSIHSPKEIRQHFKEKYNERLHNPVMSTESSGLALIMVIDGMEREIGKNIDVREPSTKRKRAKNFASKACHVRDIDVYLDWKEMMPMSYSEIYEGMNRDMIYQTVVTPFYREGSVNYVMLRSGTGKENPHGPILDKLLEEGVL